MLSGNCPAPRHELVVIRHRCVGGARRWQCCKPRAYIGICEYDESLKHVCRLFAIKTDQLNMPVRGKETIEIIACRGFQIDVRVHAAKPHGFQEYVPERNAMIGESGAALLVDSLSPN